MSSEVGFGTAAVRYASVKPAVTGSPVSTQRSAASPSRRQRCRTAADGTAIRSGWPDRHAACEVIRSVTTVTTGTGSQSTGSNRPGTPARAPRRPGRAAMPPRCQPAGRAGHPPRPNGVLRRRGAGGKRLSRLTSRPGIDQHHEHILTARRSAVVSSADPADCVPRTIPRGRAYLSWSGNPVRAGRRVPRCRRTLAA